jgi:hypothetical protein
MGALTRWKPIAVLNVKGQRIHILSLAGLPALDVDVQETTTLGYVSWTSDASRLLVPRVEREAATLLSVDLHGGAQGL